MAVLAEVQTLPHLLSYTPFQAKQHAKQIA
jgi:hypothetical protein